MTTNQWISYTPAAGTTVGPYVSIGFVLDVNTNAATLRVRAALTKGGVTVYTNNFLYRRPLTDYDYYENRFTGSVSVPTPLGDGTWSYVLEAFTASEPEEDYTADGGAYTPLLAATTARSINVLSAVSVTPLSPAAGAWVPASFSDASAPTMHQQLLSWQFGSTNGQDYQNGWTVNIIRQSTGVTLYTYNSPVGQEGLTSVVVPISNAYHNEQLLWNVRVTNRYGTQSSVSSNRSFYVGTPPTAVIQAPTVNQVLTSGVINITYTPTTSSGRTIKKVDASIWQGATQVWGRVYTNLNVSSGVNHTVSDSSFVLPQSGGTPYTLRLTVYDTQNLPSAEVQRNFTVSYALPNGGAGVAASSANYDSLGYNQVTWNNTAVDSAFYAWVVERRVASLDPNTLSVIGSYGNWSEAGRVYTQASTGYVYQDYNAPAMYSIEYRVRQIATRDGQQVWSTTGSSAVVSCVTTAYWLVGQTTSQSGTTTLTVSNGLALKLHNVTGDNFKREQVSNDFVVIGRGRYREYGDKLGVSGTLNCQIRDSGGTFARDKRIGIQSFQDLYSRFLMKNPFGDTVVVSIGDIDITRIAGTGRSEFVDISFPYVEVA